MTTDKRNPKVDDFLGKVGKWQEEMMILREFMLDSQLTEELKWGKPCYTYQKSNVALIHEFKDYCAVLFIKGALLKDEKGILVQQTENVQAGRQIRFKSAQDILDVEDSIRDYLQEAIEIEKSGVEVSFKKTTEYNIPEEFQSKLDQMPGLKAAFEALTPGRQRGYILHFSQPKQSKTREARVDKYIHKILMGKGLDD